MDQNNPNGFVESERGIILNEPLPDDKPTNTTHPQKPIKKHESKIVAGILFIILAAAVAFAMTQIDYTAITDSIAGNGYEATDELADIIDQLELTDDGMRILKATRPELQDRDAFNNSCANMIENGITLGCYTTPQGRIYIYDVTNKSLEGVRQSILAHEFLHAVWGRMSESERTELSIELNKIYDSNQAVRDDMEAYKNKRDINEMHSIVGQTVQPDDLPEKLRTHYAKYFKDHAKVVKYYAMYSTQFKQMRQRIAELKTIIDEKRKTYKALLDDYEAFRVKFESDLNEFNACANTAGCFASVEEFAAKREDLVSRKEQMSVKHKEIQAHLKDINSDIGEYNKLVVRNSDLQDSINSRAEEKQQEIVEK